MSSPHHEPATIFLPGTDRLIQDARIRYVNIDSLLADSKAHRSSKYNAFLTCSYHDFSDVLLLEKGEMIGAVRFVKTARFFISCDLVIQTVKQRQSGMLNIVLTEREAQDLVSASVLLRPSIDHIGAVNIDLKGLLKFLHQRQFDGMIEFTDGREFHFLTIAQGKPKKVFCAVGTSASESGTALQGLIANVQSKNLISRVYAFPQGTIPPIYRQAHPSQISLLITIWKTIALAISAEIPSLNRGERVELARNELLDDHPLLNGVTIDLTGCIHYNGVASAATVTEALASLMSLASAHFQQATSQSVREILEDAFEPYQTTLSTMGFFRWFLFP